jgi:competence protein ComEA
MQEDQKKGTSLLASAWASLVARVVVIAAALAVLAGIGRAATVDPSLTLATHADATVAPPPPPPPTPPPTTTALPAPPPPPAQAVRAGSGRATPETPVFLNEADETELRRLPGVGPKRAEAILAFRVRVGRFRRIEDLLRVKGVGRSTIRKWRPLVRLDSRSDSDAGAP